MKTALIGLLGALTLAFAGLIAIDLHDPSAKEGGAAPTFTITTDQGKKVTPASFGGKLLVLNFWATWCRPCVQEIPSLNRFQRKYADKGVVVVAVSIDKNPDKYRAFLDRIPVDFYTARDPGAAISAQYGTFQYPESYLIKDGKVVRKYDNAQDWTAGDVTSFVDGLL